MESGAVIYMEHTVSMRLKTYFGAIIEWEDDLADLGCMTWEHDIKTI
jgi:hypothetical protein